LPGGPTSTPVSVTRSDKWIFDAWLEEDATRLGPFTAKGGLTAYGEHAATEASDFVLAHGRVALAALLLNDDCYVEPVRVRYGSGRLIFTPVFALPEDPAERRAQLNTRRSDAFPSRRLPSSPAESPTSAAPSASRSRTRPPRSVCRNRARFVSTRGCKRR
jgi:hypothetical protein